MRRSRRLEREIDSARGLLRKRQLERKEWITRGAEEEQVSAFFDPKIQALEEEIVRLQAIEEDVDEEEVRYVKYTGKRKKGRH